MAIAGLGNGFVPSTKVEALAQELRFLKSGMADLQGRLDTLLSEIDGELQQAHADNEPVAAEMRSAPEAEIAVAVMELSEAAEIETPAVADPVAEAAEVAQSETIAAVEIADSVIVPEAAAEEPAGVETAVVENAEVAMPVAAIDESTAVADAIPTIAGTEPVTDVAVWAEPVVPAAEQVDAPAAELPGQNVVVLAEHRREAGRGRGLIARTARWAAAIALIATVAAVAAAGTGFAGNGELLKKSVCAIAGEGCSLTLGMP